jgi:hypothetical protein
LSEAQVGKKASSAVHDENPLSILAQVPVVRYSETCRATASEIENESVSERGSVS